MGTIPCRWESRAGVCPEFRVVENVLNTTYSALIPSQSLTTITQPSITRLLPRSRKQHNYFSEGFMAQVAVCCSCCSTSKQKNSSVRCLKTVAERN